MTALDALVGMRHLPPVHAMALPAMADALPLGLDAVFRAVARASIEGGLFALAIWAITRALPRLPARARATLWWLACARFVVSLAGVAPIGVPVPVTLPEPVTRALAAPAVVAPAGDAADRAATAMAAGVTTRPHGAAATLAPARRTPGPLASGSGTTAHPAAGTSSAPSSAARLLAGPIPGDTFTMAGLTLRAATAASVAIGWATRAGAWPWTAWAGAAWLILLALALAKLDADARRTVVLVRGATPLGPDAAPLVADLSARFGVAGTPDVRVSPTVRSPQLVWAGHAAVLLPSAARSAWSHRALSLALAHELAHLGRHDLLWGAAASVANRLFVFHPLARLAAREYAVAREAACDAAVLARLDASPVDYGRLLLALGVARRPALTLPGAAWSARSLRRRLVMLEHHASATRAGARWIVLPAALAAGLIGLTAAAPKDPQAAQAPATGPAATGVSGGVAGGVPGGVAAGIGTGVDAGVAGGIADGVADGTQAGATGGIAQAVPDGAAAGVATGSGWSQGWLGTPSEAWSTGWSEGWSGEASADASRQAPPPPPSPPPAPRAPAPPPPPPPPPPPRHLRHAGGFHDAADAWIYFSGDHTTMDGSRNDRRRAEAQRKGNERLFWFARDGKEYVVRDAATLDAIDKLFAPERELAENQQRLASAQAKRAEEQAEFAAQQSAVAGRMAELGARQAALGAEHARLAAEMHRVDERAGEAKARELETRSDELEHEMRKLEDEMRPFEASMRAMEPEMEKLGREMEALAEQMVERSARAGRELADLLTRSIASGVAQPAR